MPGGIIDRIRGLFGGTGPDEVAERETYEGFELQARPRREGGTWRVAGRICRPGDPDGPVHDFVRVDTMTSREECIRLSLVKARQIVDERGPATLPDAEARDDRE